ncbi:MAG: hypothetical protein WAT81_02755 [Candidatus Moraniibacteriota bacterium]
MYRNELPPVGEQSGSKGYHGPADPEHPTRGARITAEKERFAARKMAAEKMVQELLTELSEVAGRNVTLSDFGEAGHEIEQRFKAVQEQDHEGESIIALGHLMKALKETLPRKETLH